VETTHRPSKNQPLLAENNLYFLTLEEQVLHLQKHSPTNLTGSTIYKQGTISNLVAMLCQNWILKIGNTIFFILLNEA